MFRPRFSAVWRPTVSTVEIGLFFGAKKGRFVEKNDMKTPVSLVENALSVIIYPTRTEASVSVGFGLLHKPFEGDFCARKAPIEPDGNSV